MPSGIDEAEIKYGLAGVTVDKTAVSKVMQETNSLTYRGYAVQDLCAHCRWEEVAYLIWKGELPTKAGLAAFEKLERGYRALSEDCLAVIKRFRKGAHPMDTVRTAISFLGVEDETTEDDSPEANYLKSVKMLARSATAVAADYRLRHGKEPIAPREDLTYSENFFHMCFGEVPEKEVIECFDISLILYAEHSFNASTFTARVVTSTMSDIYSAVVGGIGALKGPLHGGANEAVMHMMLEIGDPAKAADWMRTALKEKRKIMGFGHRVYKNGDSRVPTMTEAYHRMAALKGGEKWVEMSKALEDVMVSEKNIYPNLDFPTGPAYYLMGFDIPMFTPIFVMSRITGWTAHAMEQAANNKLIRPLSAYNGPDQRPVTPIDRRG